jgi:hypothetical protein
MKNTSENYIGDQSAHSHRVIRLFTICNFPISYISIAIFLFLFTAGFTFNAYPQIAAYTDYRGAFQVFDRGVFQQAEYLPVKSFQAGGNSVAYVDNTGEFRIYYNGRKYHQLYATDQFSYYLSNYLTAYKVGTVLYVFEKGKSQKVSYYCSQFYVGDSLVAYYDDSNYNLGVYYNGSNGPVESSLLASPQNVKAGSNILAYVNQSGYFKLFYHGEVIDIDVTTPMSFEAGRDIVAYVDGYQKYFHLFYKGQSAQVDVNPPESYKVGYGVMAYVDYDGNFRVFNNGATRRLLSQKPDFFDVKGNMIVYAYNGEFRTFADGESKLIDDILPKEYKLSNDGVAYVDLVGKLKFYTSGKMHTVSHETVNEYYVNNDVVWYVVGTNTWKVWYNGANY